MIIILVCADCRASCHPECKEKLPLPCIPSAPSTPGTAKMSEVRLPHWSAQVEPEKQKQDFKILALSVSVNRSVSMGESTSVFIRRFVKLKCAYRDLRILKISRIKKIKKLFRFRSAIWSNPYTRPLADPCFLKLTHAHALPEVVKIVVNWRDPCRIHP